jgi:hypothetical protein
MLGVNATIIQKQMEAWIVAIGVTPLVLASMARIRPYAQRAWWWECDLGGAIFEIKAARRPLEARRRTCRER